MSVPHLTPTPNPEVNALLQILLKNLQKILGEHLSGMYLFGSLANGDFDEESDIDVAVLTDEEISPELFSQLQVMHARVAEIHSPWATQLEVAYLSQRNIRRYDPNHARHPHLDRGKGETLHFDSHARVIERYILRQRGIVVFGPPLENLIDPISPDDLRRSMLEILNEWWARKLDAPAPFDSRGYQSYTVLSLCRILYTLEHGDVVSKPIAARWAKEALPARWIPLIERAWSGRQHPQLEPELDDVRETLEFIRYTLERSKEFESMANRAA
jgi:predicted nucleotidyltransferase